MAFVLVKYLAFLYEPWLDFLVLWWAARTIQRPGHSDAWGQSPDPDELHSGLLSFLHVSFSSTCASSGWDGYRNSLSKEDTLAVNLPGPAQLGPFSDWCFYISQ